jgi:SP family general alpha glucoside:H+ symporter-like MFS transporter
VKQPDGTYQIPAKWQTAIGNAAGVGEILGLFLESFLADYFGYRKIIMGSMILMIAFLFIPFFAQNIWTFVIAEILQGFPWGVFQTVTTTYASEICPTGLRFYLTSYVNICWVIGQLIATGVLRGFLNWTSEWSYRIPFALQWIWPVPLLFAAYLAPESPWWLMRKKRTMDAYEAVKRLHSSSISDDEVKNYLALIKHTQEIEDRAYTGSSYWECFRGTNLRRTETACMVWLIQCLNALDGVYFYEQAGLSADLAFDLNLISNGISLIGTFSSWWTMNLFGRRTLYLTGIIAMLVVDLIIGFIAIKLPLNSTAGWVIGSLVMVSKVIYDMTIGPVCYVIVPEMSSLRQRIKTTALARCVYDISGFPLGTLYNYMINPSAWDWGAKIGFWYAGLAALFLVYAYFRIPETKGLTYAEIDLLFEQNVSSRKFKSTSVDVFEEREEQPAVIES